MPSSRHTTRLSLSATLLTLLVSLAVPLCAADEPAKPVFVPFVDNLKIPFIPVIEVTVNGREGRFILDTGAQESFLTRAFQEAAGIEIESTEEGTVGGVHGKKETTYENLTIDTIRFGGDLTAGPFPASLMDLSHLNRYLKTPLCGILGMNVLAPLNPRFDFPNNRLVLNAPAEGEKLPAKLLKTRAYALVTIGGKTLPLVIDTAATASMVDDRVWPVLSKDREVKVARRTMAGATGSKRYEQHSVIIPEVGLGPVTARDVPFMKGPKIVLGLDLLRRYAVTFDYANECVLLDDPARDQADVADLPLVPLPAEVKRVEDWFRAALDGEDPPAIDAPIEPKAVGAERKRVFDSYRAAARRAGLDETFIEPFDFVPRPEDKTGKKRNVEIGTYHIGEGLDMRYLLLRRGSRPANGWPLAIAMHGGGKAHRKVPHPHGWPVNAREWNSQASLAAMTYPDNAIYFVPRMVDDNVGRWWKDFNTRAFFAVIRHAILFWDVDPNRVYLLGISEGGYGTETLACRFPDKLAAANGMACGSGTSIHVENLRNLPFRTDVGEHDTAFDRRPNADRKHELLDRLARDAENSGGGYLHHLEVHQGKGHGIDYRGGPAWMIEHVRNPHPKHVTVTLFSLDGTRNTGAYWLEATSGLDDRTLYLNGSIDPAANAIRITATASTDDDRAQSPDAQQALADPGEIVDASGLRLRVWLHEELIDFTRPVELFVNGKKVKTEQPRAQLATMCEATMRWGDPNYVYAGSIDVVVP